MNLQELRKEIDAIDTQLVSLFSRRMEISSDVARYKAENNLPVYDPARERQKLADIGSKLPDDLKEYGYTLYSLLFELSRSRQSRILTCGNDITEKIAKAIENTPKTLPFAPVVACQGVEGAYSQIACEKAFSYPNIFYFQSFEAVFTAIEKGLCKYGVVPVENSTAGSVNKVYDLMMSHNFSIVRSVRIKVDHNLLAKPGTKMEDIREIFSHEQAISQCADFLSTLKDVRITPVANTAIAAKMVAESGRNDVAALSSSSCARLYSLQCLKSSVQDKGNNFTRFIVISKDLEIFPGADRTSLMCILPDKPGSLYRILSRFNSLNINLKKLESRPIPDRNFEFMFYFDLDISINSPNFIQLIGELETACDEFSYLGSYSEVI